MAFLHKEVYNKSTHFEHRFKTHFYPTFYLRPPTSYLHLLPPISYLLPLPLVKPIPFKKHSPGSSSWIPGIPLWSLFLSRTTLQEAYPFPGALSKKLSLDSRYTLVEPVPFQEHSPGSLFLSRNTLQEAPPGFKEYPHRDYAFFQDTLQKCVPKSLRSHFCNIYQMVRNRAANMKAKVYFWPGRQNLCFHIIPLTLKFMLLHAPPDVIFYKSIILSCRPNLCFHIIPQTLKFMFLHTSPAVIIYKSIFLSGRQNLCFHIIPQTLKFMFLHAPPAVIIYKSICLSGRQNLCFQIIPRTFKFMIPHASPAVIIYKNIFLSGRQNLCFHITPRTLKFMLPY